ncbi:terpene synthase family protein [Chryseobacterium sp. JUb7]|uniref:terpene synthase family protein n=1 Tax=Chryseobacterium sp. JUb7 TaxID=2940599 RepID=UPI002167B97C|nr:terpene synthase family protein [Chryseobacterium sp. JUb7]MCS3529141.1 hypothetical protein [Chryseobacterium sp. JUb7]
MKTLDFNLKYPFISKQPAPSKLKLIEEQQKEWIEYYLWMPEKMKVAYKTSKIVTLAGIIYPGAGEKGMLAIARWLLLGFAFDDYYDDKPEDVFSKIRKKTIDSLNGLPVAPDPKSPDDEVFVNEFANVRDMFKEVASDFWVKRFVKHQEIWIQGMEEEAAYYEKHHQEWIKSLKEETTSYDKKPVIYPTYENYLSIRFKISGCTILSDFVEIAAGFKMPEEIYKSDYIQKLRHHITYSIMWSNDIYGAARELEKNEVMNLVLVLKSENEKENKYEGESESYKLDKAYEEAAKMHNDGIDDFVRLTENVPDFGEYQEDVLRYIEHAKLLLQGQKEWHENSDRYQ